MKTRVVLSLLAVTALVACQPARNGPPATPNVAGAWSDVGADRTGCTPGSTSVELNVEQDGERLDGFVVFRGEGDAFDIYAPWTGTVSATGAVEGSVGVPPVVAGTDFSADLTLSGDRLEGVITSDEQVDCAGDGSELAFIAFQVSMTRTADRAAQPPEFPEVAGSWIDNGGTFRVCGLSSPVAVAFDATQQPLGRLGGALTLRNEVDEQFNFSFDGLAAPDGRVAGTAESSVEAIDVELLLSGDVLTGTLFFEPTQCDDGSTSTPTAQVRLAR